MEIKLNKKPYSNLLSNNTLASLYIENGEKMGIQFEKDPEKTQKAGGSTDMGNVSHVVPSIHPKFFIDTTASLHSKDFATVACEFAAFYRLCANVQEGENMRE